MFTSILNSSSTGLTIIIILLLSLLSGFIFSLTYVLLKRKYSLTRDFPITLVVFPFVATSMMLLVFTLTTLSSTDESRVVRASVALAGIFAMTKFRSHQRTTEDITYIFFATCIGLAMGLGYVGYAFLIEAILIGVLVIMHFAKYPLSSKNSYKLTITIPEDLNFENAFDDIFEKYTKECNLEKIKTSDLGIMFTLNYSVTLKDKASQKQFIDEIRERNGNLNVQLTVKKFDTVGYF